MRSSEDFPAAVQAEDPDLGAGEETERDIFEDLALGRHHFADPVHGIDVFHGALCLAAANQTPRSAHTGDMIHLVLAAVLTVVINDFAYTPKTLTIRAGERALRQ